MFGRRKRNRPDTSGCPRCGKPLTQMAGITRCSACGPLNAYLWGRRHDTIYACDRYGQGGEMRRAIRYETDSDNPPAIRDRPGKLTRELDR